MGAIKRFKQIAQIIGILVIFAGIAAAGVVAYMWWDSRQLTQEYDFDSGTEAGGVSSDGQDADEIEAAAETA